jgi:hypothetical protein
MGSLTTLNISVGFGLLDKKIKSKILSINDDTPAEEVAKIHSVIKSLSAAAKEWSKMVDSQVVDYIEYNGKFDHGDLTYDTKKEKRVKCVNPEKAMEYIYEESLGDTSKICEFLASNPFKQGSVKSLIGEEKHKECFETVYENGVNVKKKLSVANKKFLPKG